MGGGKKDSCSGASPHSSSFFLSHHLNRHLFLLLLLLLLHCCHLCRASVLQLHHWWPRLRAMPGCPLSSFFKKVLRTHSQQFQGAAGAWSCHLVSCTSQSHVFPMSPLPPFRKVSIVVQHQHHHLLSSLSRHEVLESFQSNPP